MKITLHTTQKLERFVCSNSKDQAIILGNGNAVSPMEGLLMSLAGCSTIDMIMILKKMRQKVKDIKVDVKAKRKDDNPRTFTKIKLCFTIIGEVKSKKAQEALDLSLEKYCSVAKSLDPDIKLSGTYNIIKVK